MRNDVPWSAESESDKNRPHISRAAVALNGSLIAQGSIQHPIDDNGHFQIADADFLRISRVRGMRIVRCRNFREKSGFLRIEEFGAELFVPNSIAAIIDHALRYGVKQPVYASLGHQDGQLSDSTSTIRTLAQPLSDWKAHIEDDDGTLIVTLSAALHAFHIEEWDTSRSNYWKQRREARIDLRFKVDPVTRVACFGSYVPTLPQEADTPALIPLLSDQSALNIENAPVGTFTQFAIGEGRWFSFYESDNSISITEHSSSPARTAAGLFGLKGSWRWPRISIRGIDMVAIAALTRSSAIVQLSLRGDGIGEFGYPGQEGYGEEIISIELRLVLDKAGLHFGLEAKTLEKRWARQFYLPLELLILRYPKFVHNHPRLADR